ncbi:hypothetical protein V8C40DRAFT_281173 [Trichoderma camerunense]
MHPSATALSPSAAPTTSLTGQSRSPLTWSSRPDYHQPPNFIVGPINGICNFVHGSPDATASIALVSVTKGHNAYHTTHVSTTITIDDISNNNHTDSFSPGLPFKTSPTTRSPYGPETNDNQPMVIDNTKGCSSKAALQPTVKKQWPRAKNPIKSPSTQPEHLWAGMGD